MATTALPIADSAPVVRPTRGLRHALRTLWLAFWLGWQVEANWTDPLLFAIYAIVRPLGGVLILVFMFKVVAGGTRGPELDFFVVGSAFWPLVLAGMQGMGWGFIDDRERFKTLRYVYTSPIPFPIYLVGRSLAQANSSLAAVAITLLFGRFVLGVPISLATTNWPYLAAALVFGIAAILGLGLLTVAFIMSVSRESWRLPEALGAALYLVCGTIFPVTSLPTWLQPVAALIPLAWWLEAIRRALLGPDTLSSFPNASDAQVMAWLAVTSIAALVAGVLAFGRGERRARERGALDQETGF